MLKDFVFRKKGGVRSNRDIVVAFYDQTFNRKDINGATEYLNKDYIQHDPQIPDGKEGFIDGVTSFLRRNPDLKVKIKRVISDEDFVVLHVFMQPNPKNNLDRGLAVVDIFRLKNGKIMEHWGVTQSIPEQSANDHGMF